MLFLGIVCINTASKMFQVKFLLLAVIAALVTAEYKITPRIIQGHDAARGQFPFYVFVETDIPQGIGRCGASLILTSAFCVRSASSIVVH